MKAHVNLEVVLQSPFKNIIKNLLLFFSFKNIKPRDQEVEIFKDHNQDGYCLSISIRQN